MQEVIFIAALNFFIKDFRSKLQIWSHLLKKSLIENLTDLFSNIVTDNAMNTRGFSGGRKFHHFLKKDLKIQ